MVKTPRLSTEILLHTMLDSDGKGFLGSLPSCPSVYPKPSPPGGGIYWAPDPFVQVTWRRCGLGKEPVQRPAARRAYHPLEHDGGVVDGVGEGDVGPGHGALVGAAAVTGHHVRPGRRAGLALSQDVQSPHTELIGRACGENGTSNTCRFESSEISTVSTALTVKRGSDSRMQRAYGEFVVEV